MSYYKRVPEQVEAWQVGSDEAIPDWLTATPVEWVDNNLSTQSRLFIISNTPYAVKACRGDWIIQTSGLDYQVFRDEEFRRTFKPTEIGPDEYCKWDKFELLRK